MRDRHKNALCLIAIVLSGVLIFASYMSSRLETAGLRQQAIERGHARHNPTTGEWEWIDEKNE